ncbi:MAG: FmdB family zinc ribbon protein [Pirellulaceae bacterium]
MPLYEYACKKCDKEFELLIRGSEQPECPTCHTTKLEKLLSVPAGHAAGSKSLPMCGPPMPQGGCGLPQCGMGACGME